jgi:hypothetical protein
MACFSLANLPADAAVVNDEATSDSICTHSRHVSANIFLLPADGGKYVRTSRRLRTVLGDSLSLLDSIS